MRKRKPLPLPEPSMESLMHQGNRLAVILVFPRVTEYFLTAACNKAHPQIYDGACM